MVDCVAWLSRQFFAATAAVQTLSALVFRTTGNATSAMPTARAAVPAKIIDKGSNAYDEGRKAEILAAYHERKSMRAMARIFGVSRNTVLAWLKKSRAVATAQENIGKG